MEFLKYKKEIEKIFAEHNIDKSEVNILFCEALKNSRADILRKKSILKSEMEKIDRFVQKRISGMPIQKIFKRAYFFEYEFYINNNVLCPRPETELLVEECLKTVKKESKVLDLCTGSGAIAITIQKKAGASVTASDISTKALYVAKKNAKRLGATVHFVRSDLFKSIHKKFDIIISNPPYIPSKDIDALDVEVKNYDPKISLDGGPDGLDFYRIIANNAKKYLFEHGKIFLEVGIGEAQIVKSLLETEGFACFVKKDYNNIERIVVGELLWLKNAIK